MFRRTVLLLTIVLTILQRGYSKTSGISQFWSDDIKVFDKIYGKTSDKELYGVTLPPNVKFDTDSKIPIQIEASEKRERYLPDGKNILDSEYYPYDLGDRYAKLFSKSLYPGKSKPSSALQFISFSDFKPISESTDPETYTYLKHLEKISEKKNDLTKHYKPHSVESNSEADEAYKSIQDILDAHEANKSNDSQEDEKEFSSPKYKTKVNEEGVRYARNRNRSKVRLVNGNSIKSRCISGRCRSTQSSLRTRPYLRKIQHYRYSKR
ncbi:uncharacterized protein LOC126772391 [Nymphalis io]|uniref:uncharacterized protein LOC126772391 n=1 Tax=Inachis io TaxID=171585 RepID=UPI002167B1DF|nr:uncharacterized protein LOC126772391 [Nymphalis io]XP_050348710.1 uncharacterized protein LOC126772391 [Nymphalis io]